MPPQELYVLGSIGYIEPKHASRQGIPDSGSLRISWAIPAPWRDRSRHHTRGTRPPLTRPLPSPPRLSKHQDTVPFGVLTVSRAVLRPLAKGSWGLPPHAAFVRRPNDRLTPCLTPGGCAVALLKRPSYREALPTDRGTLRLGTTSHDMVSQVRALAADQCVGSTRV